MKMYGSNLRDTLIGTKLGDTITALGGNDLIATSGGIDTILAGSGNDLITGFSYKLTNSDGGGGGTDDPGGGGIGGSRAAAGKSMTVDGGAGDHDIMLIEMTAASGTSEVDTFKTAIKVKNVEEFIYNFASVSADQKILGDNNLRGWETIVVGSGDADVDARSGSDFIYTSSGNDIVKGGSGSDLVHAGTGHNYATGGKGADYFHFQMGSDYQYTEITDFTAGEDKILVCISTDQVNLLFSYVYADWEALDPHNPGEPYGDGLQGVGPDLNPYVTYNQGRLFDPSEFTQNDDELYLPLWASYEQETGSIFAHYYTMVGDAIDLDEILIAHVTPGTEITSSDILLARI